MTEKTKSILILVVPFILIALIYPFLPDQIPRQFHLGGEPPSYMAKGYLFILGILPFIIYKRYRSRKN